MLFRFHLILACTGILCSSAAFAQNDTIKTQDLTPIEITAYPSISPVSRLPEIQGTIVNAGRKNEVIRPSSTNADLSVNSSRQIFGRVPGISIWENDGSGLQVGIASRGLSPNRSWEFNMRQNGYDMSADIFGYPEAYYSPPTEAVERIEIVRGAGGLQYGPQFGGMVNYVIRRGPADRKIAFETAQTAGSYGLFNSYNALGGTIGKVSYYTYFHQRSADGWRENSRYRTQTGYASLQYRPNARWTISGDFTRMNYVSQQPGGLTDEQFERDPQQSSRERNWMGIPWNIGSVKAEYQNERGVRVQVTAFGLLAERNSVGFVSGINVEDAIIDTLDVYASRQVDRDWYASYGAEARALLPWNVLDKKQYLSFGVRYYHSDVDRRQRGVGSRGSDYDLSLSNPDWGREFVYTTRNVSAFAEQVFNPVKNLLIIPGVRLETISNTASGRLALNNGEFTPLSSDRQVVLGALAAEYHIGTTEIYGNYSMGYRPVTYAELTPSGTTDIIDPDLQDASGYNIDLGYRGHITDRLVFDVSAYMLNYDNRIGTIQRDGVNFRTNIGTSETRGIELFGEYNVMPKKLERLGQINIWASLSWIEARYVSWNDPAIDPGTANDRVGKRVENAPAYIHRAGVSYQKEGVMVSLQYNMVGKAFNDALNTVEPNATATNGLIPAYEIWDLNVSVPVNKQITLRGGVNNLLNESYFTRRAGGYPGPGIMPGNGRTLYFTVAGQF
jgi:Fe(3+) dicitrate transport protein